METDKNILKYYADWAQPQGRTTKKGLRVHIHPFDLIAYVHKREGIDKAGELAVKLIAKKYSKVESRVSATGSMGAGQP